MIAASLPLHYFLMQGNQLGITNRFVYSLHASQQNPLQHPQMLEYLSTHYDLGAKQILIKPT